VVREVFVFAYIWYASSPQLEIQCIKLIPEDSVGMRNTVSKKTASGCNKEGPVPFSYVLVTEYSADRGTIWKIFESQLSVYASAVAWVNQVATQAMQLGPDPIRYFFGNILSFQHSAKHKSVFEGCRVWGNRCFHHLFSAQHPTLSSWRFHSSGCLNLLRKSVCTIMGSLNDY
jgi:hypothetical protein